MLIHLVDVDPVFRCFDDAGLQRRIHIAKRHVDGLRAIGREHRVLGPSSTVLVNSSTKSGTPSVLATICALTSGGSGRPATRSARVSTSAGARRSSAMLVTCERPAHGASYSGRKVISSNTGKARTRSTVRSSTSSEVASAQWAS